MQKNQIESLLKEEEAYQNNLFPTKKPISSDEIKRQLNNSFRSAYSNISKNITSSNFFQDSNAIFKSNTKNNPQKNLDIIPDINYSLMKQKENIINPKTSNIDLNYCLGVINNNISNCFCFHEIEKFFIYIKKTFQ